MKKYFSLFASIALLLSACVKEEVKTDSLSRNVDFIFTSEKPSFSSETKTEWNGSTILWSKGDNIRMALQVNDVWQTGEGDVSTGGKAKLFASTPLTESSATAEFLVSSSFNQESTGTFKFYGMFPGTASTAESNNISAPVVPINLKTEQTPSANSFDSSADILTGEATKTFEALPSNKEVVPFYWNRQVAHAVITFKNLALVEGENIITKIEIEAQSDAALTGSFDLNIITGAMEATTPSNSLVLLGQNLSITGNTVTAWACLNPISVSSLNVKVTTNKASYTRSISGLSLDFKKNARNTLAINMESATRNAETEYEWVKTSISDISSSDVFVIAGSGYAVSNNNGTSAAPTAVSVTVTDGKITSAVPDNILWSLSGDASNGYKFSIASDPTKFLYSNTTAASSSNNNIRVGTGNRSVWQLNNGILSTNDSYTKRYLSLYTNSDWRGYTSSSSATSVDFYVRKNVGGTDTPVSVVAPQFDVTAGTYVGSKTVKISNYNSDYLYAYTTNGSDPAFNADLEVTSGTLYDNESGIEISSSCMLKVLAIDEDGNSSDIASANYVIETSIANTAETAYTTAQAIALINAGSSQLTSTEVYVKGTISKVVSFNETYGSITYWLDDEAFEIYGGLDKQGAKFIAVTDLQEGDAVVVKGIIKKYGSTYEMDSNNVLISRETSATQISPILKLGTYKSALKENDDEDVFDVTYNGDGVITVTSSDTKIASASYSDGKIHVTPIAPGTVNISVSASATDTYYAASKSYELIVSKASGEAVFDFSIYTTTDTKTADWSLSQDSVNLTWSKGESQNTPSPNKEGSVRMYTGTTLTITAPDGTNIKSVVFTTTGANYAATNLSYGGDALTSESWTLTTAVNEVVLTGTGACRIKKMVVSYE